MSRGAFGALLTALFLVAPGLQAQQTGTVTGRVTDQAGQPVASVQVYVAGLDLGVLTQQNGRFLLQNVPAGTHTVTAERIGFQTATAEVTVGAGETVVQNFALSEEALQLEEVIVTGTPGGTQRRAIGNAVTRLDAAEVANRAAVSDIQGMLEGRAAGVRFNGLDGQVGGGRGVSIRGVSSVSLGSQPLIYVDGVRVENDATVGPNTGLGQSRTALDDLNPNEIESIEIIKGPAAATLYGTEASAGVIQIITKRGEVGEPEFTFETSQGTNFMTDPQGRLKTQYACAIAASPCPSDQIVGVQLYDEAGDFLRQEGRFAGLDLPFQPRSGDLFQYGYSQRYNLSVRGGTDQVRYYVSGSWNDATGIVDYNTDGQAAMRANVTVLLSENLNLDVSTGYVQGETQFATVPSEGGVWHQLTWGRPQNLPGIRSPDGSGFLGFQERFPQSYERTDIAREYQRFTGSLTATHNYSDWLNQRLTFGIDRGNAVNKSFIPGNADFPNAPQGSLVYGRPLNSQVTFDYSISAQYQLTQDLGTTTSFGTQYYRDFEEEVENSGRGFPTSVQTVIDQTEFSDRQVSFSSVENKSLGIYVQEELSWQDRIFLTAAVRADDNSAFGADFDLEYYPKVSGSWVISEEEFFNIDVIDNLRFRAAWGEAGRQPGTFAGQTLYTTFLGPDGNGLIPTNPGNPEIGPEVSSEFEVGFDIAVLDQRVSAEFSYYDQTTENMLVSQALAPSTGLTLGSRQANLGSMSNHGWEASVNARVVDRENVAFDLSLSGDYTTNEVTSLGEDVVGSGNFQLGWPFPNVATEYYLRSAELGNISNAMCDGGRPAADGGPNIMQGGETIACSDYNGPGILLGPSYPNYSFSIGPTLTLYQDLQIFALAEGRYGAWRASIDAQFACGVYRNCLQAQTRDDPLFIAGTTLYDDDRYQGRFPADFWRMRQIGLRYTIPESLLSGLGADRASISVAGNNLFTLWQKTETDLAGQSIYDPEYAVNGNDPSATALWEIPGMASVDATLRVTF
ncbi:MAG: SusC/RagA family TonB-linked outer membrane protein [Longimicrobiales bacterium]|nr:SusC/RagA family TonB-linked outer membrane protein [Longimicrobiales bacterium]